MKPEPRNTYTGTHGACTRQQTRLYDSERQEGKGASGIVVMGIVDRDKSEGNLGRWLVSKNLWKN